MSFIDDLGLDTDYFQDYTAWAIAGTLYLIFMALIWVVPDVFGGSWDKLQFERIIITVLAPFVLYVVAKLMLERGK